MLAYSCHTIARIPMTLRRGLSPPPRPPEDRSPLHRGPILGVFALLAGLLPLYLLCKSTLYQVFCTMY